MRRVPLLLVCLSCGCGSGERATQDVPPTKPEPRVHTLDPHTEARAAMVALDIAGRGIVDPRVLAAMREVPRHRFVAPELVDHAYDDRPLPIGHDQTISQPYIVALMTELVRPMPTDHALDIGTGSGYQAAVLARTVKDVVSIEILCPLADEARSRLRTLGYDNVEVRCGDGWKGAVEQAPFDVIIVAAAPDKVPPALVEQLAPGGRLVIPVGPQGFEGQMLLKLEKRADGTIGEERVIPVRFVPMTGGED